MSALSVTISEAYTQRYEVAAALPMRLARAAIATLNLGRLCELFADAGPLIQLSRIA
jgi:hypothetical protein